jgi:hypothetical protein
MDCVCKKNNYLSRAGTRPVKTLDRISYSLLSKYGAKSTLQANSMALFCKRTIPAKRPQHVGEVSANFCCRRCRMVSTTDPHSRILSFLDPSRYYFFQVSSSIVLTRLSGPRSRPTTSQKIW